MGVASYMTPIMLLNTLEVFIKEKTKDILLEVRVKKDSSNEKERAAEVHKMNLPTKEDEIQRIPYILLQFLTGKDTKQKEEVEESNCKIRIVVAIYSENGQLGGYDVLNVLLRIRSELQKVGVIGGYFVLQKPLEYLVYPDNKPPYHFGEMITNWSIPVIEREIKEMIDFSIQF